MKKTLHLMTTASKLFLPLVFILLFASNILPLTSPVEADTFHLGIFPPIIQIDATPPTAIRHDVTIKNVTDSPVTLSITLRPFTAKDSLGHVAFLDESSLQLTDKDIFQKIQVLDNDTPVNEVTLDAQEEKTLTLKIGLPKDEPPADYYFSIVFLTKNTTGNNNGSAIAGGIASNVLLSIGPKDLARGFIEKFSAPLYVTSGPIPFTVMVHNLSSYYISPQGQILIHNLYGQLIGKVDLLQGNILANTSRALQDSKQLSPDKAIWPEEFLFGPYSATLTISLSPQGPLFHQTVYFFALPLEYLIGFVVLILLAVFLFVRVRRRMQYTPKEL